MFLSEQLEATGLWLFRWRSYLPVLLLALVVGSLMVYRPALDAGRFDHAWEILCLGIGFLGLGVRAYTVGHVPPGTSGRITGSQVAKELNTTGSYSLARHPLYFGNLLMWMGPALYPRLWWLTVIVALVFWLYYERIMLAEEAYLNEQFGVGFVAWAQRTPAFWPRPSLRRPPSLRLSVRRALRREMSGFFGLVVTMTLLELVADFAEEGHIVIDPGWSVFRCRTGGVPGAEVSEAVHGRAG